MITSANQILFRCSSLHLIMTNGRGGGGLTDKQAETLEELRRKDKLTDKQREYLSDLIAKRDAPPTLGEGVITHLIDLFLRDMYGRREDVKSKILDKGNEREQDSITLISLKHKKMFRKNTERKKNSFISGEWDLDDANYNDGKILLTIDAKSSWSLHTFMRAKFKELEPAYKWQGVGYSGLTGSLEHEVDYCLCNGTYVSILDEKRKAAWALGESGEYPSPELIKRWRQIEINHIFDRAAFEQEYPSYEWVIPGGEWVFDIPAKDRIHSFRQKRDEEEIKAAYERITLCRSWIDTNLINPLKNG